MYMCGVSVRVHICNNVTYNVNDHDQLLLPQEKMRAKEAELSREENAQKWVPAEIPVPPKPKVGECFETLVENSDLN